ncbi:MAG TPA: NAD-dependent epimerase/dehydratase family protein [Hyphomonadaceae bacterium]|nr:NAD-dependent epimerase/dehydratase family protein [Hyphomonadaceae bacterium]
MTSHKTILVLGATGSIGGEAARAFLRRGWTVRGLRRSLGSSPEGLERVEWIKGDVMNPADVLSAARGADVIFHGVNPPAYRGWAKVVLPMIDSTIEAAAATGARIAFPGTVYNYGPDVFPLVGPDAPQNARTRKGKIRVEMERRMEQAQARGVKTLIVRAGDFFSPHKVNSWLSNGMIRPGKPLKSVTYPGRADAGHAWAFLPDLGETFARLLERDAELAPFERFHFGGHYFPRGIAMAEAVRRAAGNDTLPIRPLPWFAIVALSPFVETFREMLEMRYLWKTSLEMDNRKLVAFLGAEPHTPTQVAMTQTLEGLGCLPASKSGAASVSQPRQSRPAW